MCDAISFLRAIRLKHRECSIVMFSDCRPMFPILSHFADSVIFTDKRDWHTIFRSEAWKFDLFYDFRPHCCRVFAGDPYRRRIRLISDKNVAMMRRWKHYNSRATNKLQDLKKSVIRLNLESAEVPNVPYHVEFPMPVSSRQGTFLTINTGAMGAERGQIQTKQWDSWQSVVDTMKAEFKIPIVQVGAGWEKRLMNVKHLWNRPLLQVASLLKTSTLHLGNENGMIRLRRLVTDKPSVVVFGPTPQTMYGFEGNANLWANVCRPCFWYTGDWMWECAMGWDKVCMRTISVERVIDAVRSLL